jgi:hypothetical protein
MQKGGTHKTQTLRFFGFVGHYQDDGGLQGNEGGEHFVAEVELLNAGVLEAVPKYDVIKRDGILLIFASLGFPAVGHFHDLFDDLIDKLFAFVVVIELAVRIVVVVDTHCFSSKRDAFEFVVGLIGEEGRGLFEY